jgi:hypothetical protein
MVMPSTATGNGRLSLLAGCAVALLSGCVAVAPAAGTQFDGSYAGQNSLVRGWGFQCGPPGFPERIDVSAGRFYYPFPVNVLRATPLPVQIAADGSFSGQIQYGTEENGIRPRSITVWAVVTGRITGTTLEGTVTDYRCVRRLVAQRG